MSAMLSHDVTDPPEITSDEFRHVLGHFCTGVAVVTTLEHGEPIGFACQSVTALSLDPPLITFCPIRNSRAWAAIDRVGRFSVNVLAQSQREVSATFGRPGRDKFSCTDWRRSAGGTPVLADSLAWIDCIVEAVYPGGDHQIVVGRVTGLGASGYGRPLLFYRGAYAATEIEAQPDATHDSVPDGFLSWIRPDGWL